jgi:hypothetical protein
LASENFGVCRLVSGNDCTVSLQDDWEWLLKAVEGVEISEGALWVTFGNIRRGAMSYIWKHPKGRCELHLETSEGALWVTFGNFRRRAVSYSWKPPKRDVSYTCKLPKGKSKCRK